MVVNPHQTILIVEDSPEDYETTIRALKKAGISNNTNHCEDGDEALDYLFRRGAYTDHEKFPLPGVILLDLNLPGMSGVDLCRQIRNRRDFPYCSQYFSACTRLSSAPFATATVSGAAGQFFSGSRQLHFRPRRTGADRCYRGRSAMVESGLSGHRESFQYPQDISSSTRRLRQAK